MKYEIVTIGDREYPRRLREINNPPQKLYYIGDISLANSVHSVAVVGARKASEYGRLIAIRIGERLAERGVTVVSGMAQGIDSFAHAGCLGAGGKTIAVLGTGIDVCYPQSNRALKREIEEKGLLLSEFPAGFSGNRASFPVRNRIISGLCSAVAVVEAGLKSGSLITAELAAEQGRMVYAVPGNITSVMSLGTNKLIQDGAAALATIEDLLSDLGLGGGSAKNAAEGLDGDELKIFLYLCESGESSIDRIGKALGLETQRVCTLVTFLEMKGLVSSGMGKIFIAK